MHAGARVLRSLEEEVGWNATAGWNGSHWEPRPRPSPNALAAIPIKSAKASSTKAVALQHLKVGPILCVCSPLEHEYSAFAVPSFLQAADQRPAVILLSWHLDVATLVFLICCQIFQTMSLIF